MTSIEEHIKNKESEIDFIKKFFGSTRYYPTKLETTIRELYENEDWKSGLPEEVLDDFTENYHEVRINLSLWLFDYQVYHNFCLIWGTFRGKKVFYQERDDWGLIYHSIRIEGYNYNKP